MWIHGEQETIFLNVSHCHISVLFLPSLASFDKVLGLELAMKENVLLALGTGGQSKF